MLAGSKGECLNKWGAETPLRTMRTEFFQNLFLPLTTTEWNKLDFDVRNVDTYSFFCKNLFAFIRLIANSLWSIYDPLGIKLLHRLRLGFSHLLENKFKHNFADTVNPLCSSFFRNWKHAALFSTLPQLCHLSHNPYEWVEHYK